MVDYIGSRRVVASASADQAQRMFAEDDAAPTCPKCGATIRAGQEWCTLCLHVLRPEPDAPNSAESDEPVEPDDPPGGTASTEPSPEAGPQHEAADPKIDVDAAAEALLAQLAIETRRDSLQVPAFLNSKVRVAVFVIGAMAVLCAAALLTMGIAGQLFH